MKKTLIIYKCGCCDSFHPWEWDGDCRDDAHRIELSPEEYAETLGINPSGIEIRSMEERLDADLVEIT